MNDDNNLVQSSSLNTIADSNINVKLPPSEEYTKGDEGNKIAIKHQPLPDTGATPNRSWVLSEIERTVASEVLPVGRQKIAQFGVSLSRKQDFRMRDLTRKLDKNIRLVYPGDTEKPESNTVKLIRDFDVRTQSYHQITSNAALGAYQFQRQVSLPYMRKSLALVFQKTHLLKKVVGAIGGLENSIVSKLEAIKMNTAAAAPTKVSLFTRIRNAVRDKQIDRVATNLANRLLERHAAVWDKTVSPIMVKLHKVLGQKGVDGGFNGATKGLTRKLNRMRRDALGKNGEQFDEDGNPITTGKGLKSKALGAAVKFGQKFRLGPTLNNLATKPLYHASTIMENLNPFANGQVDKGDFDDLEEAIEKGGTGKPFQLDSLTKLLGEWRDSSAGRQRVLIDHTAGIHKLIAKSTAIVPTKNDKPVTRLSPVTRPNMKVGARARMMGTPVKATPNLSPRSVTMGRIFRPTTNLANTAALGKIADIVPGTKPLVDPANLDIQTTQATLLGKAVEQLSGISAAITGGNAARSLYEKVQTKRQQLADKLTAKMKIRKGSYEEMMAARQAKKGLANSDQLKNTSKDTMDRILSGKKDDKDAAPEEEDKDDSFLDTLSDMFGDKEDDKDDDTDTDDNNKKKKKPKRKGKGTRFRRGRPGARDRLARMRAARGGKGIKGLLGRGVKGIGRGAWGATKGVTKLGGRGLFGALKGGGKGIITLAKSGVGKGVGVGLLASLAGSALQNSDAPEVVKEAGGTLSSMASYGSMGAGIGSMFGGVGAVPGAVIGASIGALVENADKASAALSSIKDGVSATVGGMWTAVFGQHAKLRPDGRVIQREKSSILGDIKIAIFGRKARYSSTGEVIATERSNLIGNLNYGFQKMFFGDKFSNGEYQEGTSIVAMARDGITDALVNFKNQLINLPGDLAKGFKNGALAKGSVWAASKVADGAVATKNAFKDAFNSKKDDPLKAGPATTAGLLSAGIGITNFFKSLSAKDAKNVGNLAMRNPGATIGLATMFSSPTAFAMGVSNAAWGWWIDSGTYDDPATPQYKFIELTLRAYGIKNRALYKYVHSLEVSQEKVNNQQAKPFDDRDMIAMAGRFGFDQKNSDCVNYFKLWYKQRFLPAMGVVDKVLKSRGTSFGGVMSADNKELEKINELLKKEIAGSGIMKVNLEPSVEAYNRYSKIGTKDPGGLTPATANTDRPFDPRAPGNSAGNNAGIGRGNLSGDSDGYTSNEPGAYGDVVGHKKAKMVDGQVKDQPEFKEAYQKLPPNIKQVVARSRPLQFVLWSTSIQHGGQQAALIFERDYTENMDDKSYIRSIYQDRSRQFSALNGNDRASAVGRLGQEMEFAQGLNNNSFLNRGQMRSMVGDVYDPNGNYSAAPRQIPKGTVRERAIKAVQYLMQKGYTKPAAAGIVGNLMEESQMDYTNTKGDSGNSHGLAQWNGSAGAGRRRISLEQKFFKGPTAAQSMFKQLDAIDWEMSTGHHVNKGLKQNLQNSKSAYQAAVLFMNGFERPKERIQNAKDRGGYAQSLMNAVGDNTPNLQKQGSTPATSGGQAGKPQAAPKPASNTPAPAATPAPRPARKPAPKPATTPNESAAWMAGLADMATATREHTIELRKANAAPKPTTNNTVLSPVITKGRDGSGASPFLAFNMKKSLLVTGNK